MAKEKKILTEKQKLNRIKTWKNVCRVSEIAVLPVPFVTMAIVNRAEWFPTPEVGIQVGVGGAIAVFLLSLIAIVLSSQKEKKLTDGYGILLIIFGLITAIAMLLRYIADQVANICLIGMSGIGAGFGIDLTKKALIKKENEQADIVKTAEKNQAIDKATKELLNPEQNKKIKVKIKK